jgi:hypothetical protein
VELELRTIPLLGKCEWLKCLHGEDDFISGIALSTAKTAFRLNLKAFWTHREAESGRANADRTGECDRPG